MSEDEGDDGARRAILERRALLVASALATLSVAASCGDDPGNQKTAPGACLSVEPVRTTDATSTATTGNASEVPSAAPIAAPSGSAGDAASATPSATVAPSARASASSPPAHSTPRPTPKVCLSMSPRKPRPMVCLYKGPPSVDVGDDPGDDT
jgi:hypothetical protein